MSKRQQSQEKESDWKKVGPCLYRYKSGTYYALLKHKGKQIRRSLETNDLELARRKLPGVRLDLEATDPDLARRTLNDHKEAILRDPDRREKHRLQHPACHRANAGRLAERFSKGDEPGFARATVSDGSRNMATSPPAPSTLGFLRLQSSSILLSATE